LARLKVWSVDPLRKVFREDPPEASRTVRIEAARNEFESGQIALQSDEDAFVRASCASVEHREGRRLQCMPRFVGHVHVRENVRNTPPEEVIHPAPAEFPDYLMDENPIRVTAGETQPLWLNVFVPRSAPHGRYRGSMVLSAGEDAAKIEIELMVHACTVPSDRTLYLTNWINPANVAKFGNVPIWSEAHWRLLRNHAKSMALHRQNVILTPLSLIRIRRREQGLLFDFSDFDRWVKTFQDSGVDGLIEGSHLAGRSGDWPSGFHIRSWEVVEDGKRTAIPSVPVESAECEAFLSQFLPALQDHLEEKGWTDIYLQHLADEPIDANAESYRCLADLVKRYSPALRRIDAAMTQRIEGCLEVWVPPLDHFDSNRQYYRSRAAQGEQVWFYTCLSPTGRYPNRFIDFSLLKVRLLHWINFKYDLKGYLHWGYNHWTANPFQDTQPDWSHGAPLPAGDQCIVYPGPKGPLESLRFEAMRDGVEDYELLKVLEAQDSDSARGICDAIIRTPTDYDRTVSGFRKARRTLLKTLVDIQS